MLNPSSSHVVLSLSSLSVCICILHPSCSLISSSTTNNIIIILSMRKWRQAGLGGIILLVSQSQASAYILMERKGISSSQWRKGRQWLRNMPHHVSHLALHLSSHLLLIIIHICRKENMGETCSSSQKSEGKEGSASHLSSLLPFYLSSCLKTSYLIPHPSYQLLTPLREKGEEKERRRNSMPALSMSLSFSLTMLVSSISYIIYILSHVFHVICEINMSLWKEREEEKGRRRGEETLSLYSSFVSFFSFLLGWEKTGKEKLMSLMCLVSFLLSSSTFMSVLPANLSFSSQKNFSLPSFNIFSFSWRGQTVWGGQVETVYG